VKAYGRPLFGPEEGLPAPRVSSNETPAPTDLPRAIYGGANRTDGSILNMHCMGTQFNPGSRDAFLQRLCWQRP
jgi:hypothetical protein